MRRYLHKTICPDWVVWTICVAAILITLALAGAHWGCSGGSPGPTPTPTPTPVPPPDTPPTLRWRSQNQLEVYWADMPITIYGGSENYVLRRHAVVTLGEPAVAKRVGSRQEGLLLATRYARLEAAAARPIKNIQTFMGFDNGDAVEAHLLVYVQGGEAVYRRSPHLERVTKECYEAYDPGQTPLVDTPAQALVIDALCRTTDFNAQGLLQSHCHLTLTVTFGEEG